MKRMRYLIVVMLVTLFLSQGIRAQEIEITPLLGYTFRSDLRFIEGTMEVKDILISTEKVTSDRGETNVSAMEITIGK